VAFAALAASSHSGLTADLPVAPTAPPAALLYQWSGFYMGLNGGAVFASVEDSVATIATRTILASGTAKRTAGEAGTQIGFNVTYGPNIVLGGEVDLGWSNSRPRFQAPDGTFRIDDKFEAISTWRGRVGFALDNWLFYGTGGGAWTDGRAARTQLVPVAGGGGVLDSASNGRFGWTAGGGVEVGFARNWTIRAEYLYLTFNSVNMRFPISATNLNSTLTMQIARAAINYKFDWGGQTYVRN
jgi:opacity protein-like surface antigen